MNLNLLRKNGFLYILKTNIASIKNLSFYLSAAIISGLIGVVFNPFLAKNLSPTDYSIIGYFSSFSSLFTPILNFSLISYYVRNYFKIDYEKRQLTLDTIITSLLIWGVFSSLLILVLFYIYTNVVDVKLPFMPFALMSIAQLFFSNFLLLYQVNCRMEKKAKKYFKITLSSSLIGVLLTIFLVIIVKYGAVGRMSALLIASITIGYYSIKNLLFKFRIDFGVFKEAFSFGWPISISSIIHFFLIGIDISIVETLNDVSTMSLYVISISIVSYLSILYSALAQTFEPDLYKAVADYNYKKIAKIVLLIVSILVPIVIVFVLFAKPIISILTYNRYTDAYYYARILSLGVITTYLMIAIEGIINAFGYTKINLMNKIIGAIIAIALYYFLIKNFQFVGAAWGRVLAPIIIFVAGVFSLLFLKNKIIRKEYAEKK